MYLENMEQGDSRLFLYKQKHNPLGEGRKPWVVSGHANDIEYMDYDDMHNVHLKDLVAIGS